MLSREREMKFEQVQDDEISAAIAVLSAVTSIKHEFDNFPAGRNGGQVRHLLEIGDRRLLAWLDDVNSVVVVTPLECWSEDMWVDVDEDEEPIPVLSFRQLDGLSFQNLAKRSSATPVRTARRRQPTCARRFPPKKA